MKVSLVLLSVFILGQTYNNGAIEFNIDGVKRNFYVVSSQWASQQITVNKTYIKFLHNTRAYIATNASSTLNASNYFQFKLLNKTLSYTVDLSTVDCSCNAAVYFVSMPGYDQTGKQALSDTQDYYCDANQVGGVWCWELDVLEANRYALASTPHMCDTPAGAYISNCHRGGCGTNSFDQNSKGMCPNSSCIIDTRYPFQHDITYKVENGSLTRIYNKLTQNGKNFTFDACGEPAYIKTMTDTMSKGMVLTLSLWGSTYSSMQWLDGKTGCTGDCSTKEWVKFSNFKISKAGYVPPLPPPPVYIYGGQCSAGSCGSLCAVERCKWSWPKDDPAQWNSKQANCRCEPVTSFVQTTK